MTLPDSVGNALRGVPFRGVPLVRRTPERHGGRSLQAERPTKSCWIV